MNPRAVATASELRKQAAAFLQQEFAAPAGTDPAIRFSPFSPSQVEEAMQLAKRFSSVANARGGLDGVGDVLEAARGETRRRLPGLVKYALLLFLTHDPIGAEVGAPSLEERHPRAVQAMAETQDS